LRLQNADDGIAQKPCRRLSRHQLCADARATKSDTEVNLRPRNERPSSASTQN
jgi:hypothetical protein